MNEKKHNPNAKIIPAVGQCIIFNNIPNTVNEQDNTPEIYTSFLILIWINFLCYLFFFIVHFESLIIFYINFQFYQLLLDKKF